jgi:hypothetical protein
MRRIAPPLVTYLVARMAELVELLYPAAADSFALLAMSSKIFATCCGVLPCAKTASGNPVLCDRLWSKLANERKTSSFVVSSEMNPTASLGLTLPSLTCSRMRRRSLEQRFCDRDGIPKNPLNLLCRMQPLELEKPAQRVRSDETILIIFLSSGAMEVPVCMSRRCSGAAASHSLWCPSEDDDADEYYDKRTTPAVSCESCSKNHYGIKDLTANC